MDEIEYAFCKIIQKYNPVDIFLLLILCRQSNVGDIEEEFDGAINLFAKIISQSKSVIKTKSIDFFNESHTNKLANVIIDYLLKKYKKDRKELQKIEDEGKITRNQYLYELASPKTYSKIFVEGIDAKLSPFNEMLIQRYKIDSKFIKISCEKIYKNAIKQHTLFDVLNHSITEISTLFPHKFLDDLININERNEEILNINSFSKKVCIPIIKVNSSYHILSFELFIDSFYQAVHRLCKNEMSKEQNDGLSNLKGQNFNTACEEVFKKEFCFENVYSNFEYSANNEDGEIDLLISDKDLLIVIECKSRNYTDKISGISSAFKKANKNNLDFASSQIQRFLEILDKKRNIKLHKGKEIISIDKSKYNFIIPLVINLANLAEINTDYFVRNKKTLFISYDDLKIISSVLQGRKALFVDFCSQFLSTINPKSMSDDIIDTFAFYCQKKNLSLLQQENCNVVIYQLGNDYFQDYFSYSSEINPINLFDNDINTFNYDEFSNYKEAILNYHKTGWEDTLKFD